MTRRAILALGPAAVLAGQAASRPMPRPEPDAAGGEAAEAGGEAAEVFEAGAFDEGVFS